MKKIGVLLLALLLVYISLNIFVQAQEIIPLPDPVGGKINEETGLPESLDKLREIGEKLSKEEQRKEYLKQEWTKLLADKKAVGPVLFYTNKFFIFFNPLWKFTFGIEFFWSWAFIFSLGIWILLIILVYYPAKAFTDSNPLLALIASIIIASIAGSTGLIKKAVEMLTDILTNIWLVGIAILIAIIIISIYPKFMKSFEKEAEEEKLKQAKENIKAHGEVSEKIIKSYKKE